MKKFRVWSIEENRFIDLNGFDICFDGLENQGSIYKVYEQGNINSFEIDDVIIEQFTGLQDKNGVKWFDGDLVNVFFTSGNGEYNHDCIYVTSITPFGIRLTFKSLLWQCEGLNQYPISLEISAERGNLRVDSKGVYIPNSYGENSLFHKKWKQEDESHYFEIIGNIHQNPELL